MSFRDDDKQQRLCAEPARYLPVCFVVLNIVGLYTIYMFFHIVPMLDDPATRSVGIRQCGIFNYITFFLVLCYIRCFTTHPGTIPEKDVDPSWEFVPRDLGPQAINLQETKRSGDRRHCKWCAKYKPDRTHHCRVCRTCILKMDHHCPWIYNCVGFKNHKYFFLLLVYTVIDCHIIAWTMIDSVEKSMGSDTQFAKMFLLLFGETLATFLGVLLTAFFCFHIYLMTRAMTTIEFCEKQLKRSMYDSSVYNRGSMGNIKAVLGNNVLTWPFPFYPPAGDGLQFLEEDTRMNRDTDVGRNKRRAVHKHGSSAPPAGSQRRRRSKPAAAGTGSAPSSQSDLSGEGDEDDETWTGEDTPGKDLGSKGPLLGAREGP